MQHHLLQQIRELSISESYNSFFFFYFSRSTSINSKSKMSSYNFIKISTCFKAIFTLFIKKLPVIFYLLKIVEHYQTLNKKS